MTSPDECILCSCGFKFDTYHLCRHQYKPEEAEQFEKNLMDEPIIDFIPPPFDTLDMTHFHPFDFDDLDMSYSDEEYSTDEHDAESVDIDMV
jgi:hypothetical protein|tara:strand:- start:13 stop:288 length:276 start_codon:yes stop_codon:yes gene_type:complete